MKYKLLIVSLLFTVMLQAHQLPIGNWRTHFAYNNITKTTQSDEKVYAISNGSLFSVGKYDELVETYSKLTGLSDSNIDCIGYSQPQEMLVIAYNNSNIDLITATQQVYNITDIYRKSINSSKSINKMLFKGNMVYLACDFGIVVINLSKKEVADTYIIGPNASMVAVKSLVELNNTFYALTPETIYTAPCSGVNLANYQNWSKLTTPSSALSDLVSYNQKLYLLDQSGLLYTYNNQDWNQEENSVTGISSNDDVLFISYKHAVKTIRSDREINTVINYAGMGLYDPEHEQYWLVSATDGLMRKSFNYDYYNLFKPAGTSANSAWRIRYNQGRIYVVPGGRWSSQNFTAGTVMILDEDDNWKNIENQTIVNATGRVCTDLVDIAVDPTDKTHFFVASYGMGLYEFRNDQPYQLYNYDNSGVETHYPNDKPNDRYYIYHRVDGLTYDASGNLWFLNPGTYPIKYMTPGYQFNKMNYEDTRVLATPQDIIIDEKYPNLKWVLAPRAQNSETTCLYVFDDNGTLSNLSDDKTRYFASFYDQDNNAVQPTNFRCIVQDKNNSKWIGTSSGMVVLENISRVFESSYRATRIKIPRNDGTNLADYLLDGEQINAIAVDGGNRKWIGTESSGLYLVSDDGIETIQHFTADNSPLLSNTIMSLCLNEETGELFIGTSNGLISYQTDATEAGEVFNNVHAFPNPVRETYHGIITITGLIADTRVKITDLSGNVVYETISNGGIATWDGTRKGGQRVATGVYLVMCISSDGSQKATTKILFIN